MFELVKNVIADKETTWEFKRTLPTISFCLLPYDVGILITLISTQQQFISFSLFISFPWNGTTLPFFFPGEWGILGRYLRHVPTLLRK